MTKQEIEKKIFSSKKYIALYFTAAWCGPCKMFKYILEDFYKKNSEKVDVIKVDVSDDREIALEYGVSSVPTLLFFKNNVLKTSQIGVASLNVLESKILD